MRKIILQTMVFVFISSTAYTQLHTPLRRPVSPEQPMWLIHIDTWNYADPQKIIDLIPKDIRPFVVMNIALSISHDEATGRFEIAEYGYEIAKSWLRTCAENRMWAMVQPSSGGYSQFSDFDLSVYEEFYRDYPNMIGFNYCEQFWGYYDASYNTDPMAAVWTDRIAHFARLLELSNRYGGYLVVSWCGNQWSPHINPIGMLKRNPDFEAACRAYTENYILCEKFTQQSYISDMESLCLGACLSGYSGQYGIRYDDTGWTDANGDHANFTMATYGAPFLEHVMLTGQTVIDAPELIWTQCFRETDAVATTNGFTKRQWETFPQFDNVSVDLFRKVLDGTVRIPGRQEVIDRTKVVIINDVTSGSDDDKYSSPETLFQWLYRMDGDGNLRYNKTFFKKTGRYPTVPTVYQLDDSIALTFQVQVNKTEYASRWYSIADKVDEFDALFPEEYTGDLYAGRHENGWVTYNPYKTGQKASASIPFKYNSSDSMELTYSQYTAGVIKEYADHLTIYLSNYDNRINSDLKADTIRIYGSSAEPTFTFEDRGSHRASVLKKNWTNGVFTLTILHNGPVDIRVNCSGTATGRLTEYRTAGIAVPDSPPAYTGPRQHEAETFDYKNIAGIVKNGYDGNIRHYTGQGYLQFGTHSNASVRDDMTVLNDGTYLLETRYTLTGGDVHTIDLYVNSSRVATPLFTQTDELSSWAVDSQYVELHMGVNTIEYRANAAGAQTIYFDNMVVGSSNDDDIWLEAECGTAGALWETASDKLASNHIFVTIPSGYDPTVSAPVDSGGHILYDFNAGESGTYTAWGRVMASTAVNDTLWAKMDDGSWSVWNDSMPSTSWTWVKIDTFTLAQGGHTITVAYNEDGAWFDKMLITQSDSVLSGKGGPATNCLMRNQSPIAYAGSDKTVSDSDDSGDETVTLNATGSIDMDGSIVSYAWSEGDSLIATGLQPSVDLSVGVHVITLTVTDNHGATDTDDVIISLLESGFAYYNIWLEPECATIGDDWDILHDEEASNDHYVTVKPGIQSLNQAPASDDGLITFPFSVNYTDTYSVYGRLNCPTWDDDSYWVKMDDGAFEQHNGLQNDGWYWRKFNEYELNEGMHTFAVGYREDGAQLDKILVSNYPDLPVGPGGEAMNICEIGPLSFSAEAHPEEEDDGYALWQNYPNPFHISTSIKYRLKKSGHVYLSLYNLNGQEILTMVNQYQAAGEYEISWQPIGLPGGIYCYRLLAGEFIETRKIVVQK